MKITNEATGLVTLQEVKRAVYSWSLRFRSTELDNNQLALLSREYLEDLHSEHVTSAVFDAAVKQVRKTCRFFPTMADIMDAVREIWTHPQLMPPATSTLRIAEHTATRDNLTPEEVERNKERLAHIQAMLAGKMSIDDAVAEVEKLSHISVFCEGGVHGCGETHSKASTASLVEANNESATSCMRKD